jgi:hypothetical protein
MADSFYGNEVPDKKEQLNREKMLPGSFAVPSCSILLTAGIQ